MDPRVGPARAARQPGSILAPDVLALLAGLDKGSKCFATERSKRRMLAEKRGGVLCGERSIRRVELRLVKQGRIVRRRIMPGGRLPNGNYTSKGTVVIELLSRQVARARARAERKRARTAATSARRIGGPSSAPVSATSSSTASRSAAADASQVSLATWIASGAAGDVSPEALAFVTAATSRKGRGPP
jgi:hypothetical protein